jgi:YidC/Oxa1 family membrane protein insertase
MPRYVESPGFLEPLAQLFGAVINALFNIVYAISPANSLGIAIILMTIIFRLIIMPLGLKSQKSMMKMRELKPELDKIKAKYGTSKDPEIMKKMQQEQSALLAKHGANPLSGCLPMLIQMPLFIGLNIVMRQAALYITTLSNMYENLAVRLLGIPGLVDANGEPGVIRNLAEGRVPYHDAVIHPEWINNLNNFMANLSAEYWVSAERLREAIAASGLDMLILGFPEDLARVLSRFTIDEWQLVYNYIPAAYLSEVQAMVAETVQIQNFFGVSIVGPSGLGFPGILIPIFTGVSMFFSMWIMQQRTFDPNADERTVMTQKMTLYVMPVMMMALTINLVAAVGVFWVTGQIFQIIQDIVLLKKSGQKIRLPFSKQPEVVDVVPVKKKKKER